MTDLNAKAEAVAINRADVIKIITEAAHNRFGPTTRAAISEEIQAGIDRLPAFRTSAPDDMAEDVIEDGTPEQVAWADGVMFGIKLGMKMAQP